MDIGELLPAATSASVDVWSSFEWSKLEPSNRGHAKHHCQWRPSSNASPRSAVAPMPRSPTIEITYCRLCGWGLRASWMAQELLTTFAEELGSVTLTPDVTGGVFEVRVDDDLIWSRKEMTRLPDIKELKRLVRDHVSPDRSLGHTDRGQ